MMAIIVGTNSWVTIPEADTYLTSKISAENWFDLEDNPVSPGRDSKESFLVESFNRLLYNVNYSLSPSVTATAVKNAQVELALFLLNNYCEYTKREGMIASGIESFTYSKWKEALGDSVKIPHIVEMMLQKSGYSSANFLEDVTVE